MALAAILCMFAVSGTAQATVPTGVGACWDSLKGVYEGTLEGTASAGGQSDGMSASGENLEIEGTWIFDVREDGTLEISLGGGLSGNIPLIVGTGTVNMDTGVAPMSFSIPLIETMLGDLAPEVGFAGTGTIDCYGNFSFGLSISPVDFLLIEGIPAVELSFNLNGTLGDDGVASGTWGFDFPTLEVDPATLLPGVTISPVTVWFDAGGTFAGAKQTEPVYTSPVITATAQGSGTISPSGTVEVSTGADQTFTFTPEGGCQVLEVIVDGGAPIAGPMDSYTFEGVTGDHTLVVKFGSETLWDDVPGVYAGTLEGSLAIPGSFMVNDVVIPFEPALQGAWEFDLGEDGSALITISGGPPIFLFGDITPVFDDIVGTGMVDTQTGAAQMIFTIPTFGVFEGTGQFTCDNQFTFEIPDLGYTLSGTLNEDGTVSGTWTFASSLCFVSFDAGGSFSGELVALPTDSFITATTRGAGTISPSGVVAVANGAEQTFTFTPAAGCEVLDVIVDDVSQGVPDSYSYTFGGVSGDHTIKVKFGSDGLWATLPGTYAGSFDGEVSDPLLLPAEGTWSVVVVDAETNNISVTVQGPSIMGTFGTITGEGTVDQETGAADLVFQIPVLGEAAGTAQFDCAGGFSFEVPDFGFSMSGQVAGDRSISGTWALDGTMVFFAIAASGDLTESAKYTDPQTIEITAVGPGRVLPFGTQNDTELVRVEKGESPVLSFTPYTSGGCEVLEVFVDGESIGAPETHTFESIDKDYTVTVLFGSETLWDDAPGTYTGDMEGEVAYRILGSTAQQEAVNGSWRFDVGADGQLEIVVQGLPVIGDITGTGTVEDPRTGYAPIDFSIPGLDDLLSSLGGLVPNSLAGYGQFYCDRTFEFYMSYFGVTMTLEGTLGAGGWAFGTWEVGSESLFVMLDGQGAFSTDVDGDSLPDSWEVGYGLDPTDTDDAVADPDNDGLTSLEEYALGTSPVNNDTDGDGLTDGQEEASGTNPLVVTAGPGIPEPVAPGDGTSLVSLTPTLTVDYREGFGSALHAASVWQLALDEVFSTLVFEADSDTALLEIPLPEAMLEAGATYFWRTRFVDTEGRQWLWSEPVAFTTDPAPFADANNNNIPDDQEVTAATDLDGNGVSDGNQADLVRVTSSDGDNQLGLTTGDGGQTIIALSVVDPSDLPDDPSRPEDLELPFGLVCFRVAVANPGDTADVTIFFSEALDEDAAWYKYDAVNGWWDFSGNARFARDMRSVTLTLTDGGAGDADGVANGVIVDPSGPAVTDAASPVPVGAAGGGGGGCFIMTAGGLADLF